MTRDQEIATDYVAKMPVAEIARTHGIGVRRVYQILDAAGIERNEERKGQEHYKPLSSRHQKIGEILYNFYFDEGYSRREAANKLDWSTVKLRFAEKGAFNLTLFDIQDIALFTGVSVEVLVNG